MSVNWRFSCLPLCAALLTLATCAAEQGTDAIVPTTAVAALSRESLYPEIEEKLTPLATPIPKPGPSDWLANHKEEGQSFEQYLAARPVRRSDKLTTIYICLIGEFTAKERERCSRRPRSTWAFCTTPRSRSARRSNSTTSRPGPAETSDAGAAPDSVNVRAF